MSEKIELREARNGFSARDMHSKAVLNRDADSLMKYKIQKSRIMNQSSEIESIRSDISNLRDQMDEIKNLLLKITSGR